jgi:hypothetical protein
MTLVYMNTDDIYQLFLKFDVPGVRKDAGRIWKDVNTGDAGVMNELLQAAYDPSAGQRAVQAGEAVQHPCLAEDRRFELKRKADVYELELAECQLQVTDRQLQMEERQLQVEDRWLKINKQNLEHVDHFIESLSGINPDWCTDARLVVRAQELLCNTLLINPRLASSVAGRSSGDGGRSIAGRRPRAGVHHY